MCGNKQVICRAREDTGQDTTGMMLFTHNSRNTGCFRTCRPVATIGFLGVNMRFCNLNGEGDRTLQKAVKELNEVGRLPHSCTGKQYGKDGGSHPIT